VRQGTSGVVEKKAREKCLRSVKWTSLTHLQSSRRDREKENCSPSSSSSHGHAASCSAGPPLYHRMSSEPALLQLIDSMRGCPINYLLTVRVVAGHAAHPLAGTQMPAVAEIDSLFGRASHWKFQTKNYFGNSLSTLKVETKNFLKAKKSRKCQGVP